MPLKIFGDVEIKIKDLVKKGYNANRIALEVGLSEGTISFWAKRNGVILEKRISPETIQKKQKFLDLLRSGMILKHACLESKLDHRAAVKLVKDLGLDYLLRDRRAAARDRQLSIEEANARLPVGHGKIDSYDAESKRYAVKRDDGTIYFRILSQLFRGDPALSQKKRSSEEEISLALSKIGYRLILGTYSKKHNPIQAEHLVCGYIRENVFYNFDKQKCPRCSNKGTSKEEVDLSNWIKSLGIITYKYRFKKDCKGKGKGKEIDIFVPDLMLGIEYCGLFHHGVRGRKRIEDGKKKYSEKREKIYESTDYDNPKLTHKIKLDKSNEEGINLITIFSHEWKNDREKVKNILRAKLGKNERRIYARNTVLKEISSPEAKKFLDLYHLQGGSRSVVSFGLYFGDELISVISGNVHHRNNREFVLNRLCFKGNVTVVGGSSKLNNALENWAKSNGFEHIKSWSDNRWSDGTVYRALGYSLVNEIAPDYFYFDGRGNTYSKQSCQKKNLIKKGGIGETEWEMAQSLKLDRIWDCGKKTWVKKLV